MSLKIEKIFAFITADGPGEGILAFHNAVNGTWYPLVGADQARIDSYRAIAQRIADETGRQVELVEFTGRRHLDVIQPRGRA